MFSPLRAVFFDVDGVLLDSLPQHLRICHDKAVEFGLKLRIPNVEEFRSWVSRGVRVSPMRYFFLAVGFPPAYADRAVTDYEREFAHKYRPQPFEGVDAMLRGLHDARLTLGMVTSNTRDNVLQALGPTSEHFESSYCYFFERDAATPRPKSWFLANGAQLVGGRPTECVYVGDQPADADAARDAGVHFLGVTYGWGITRGDTRYETVDTVAGIANRLLVCTSSVPSADRVAQD
jgi:phosphoglycolate phosphatase